MDNFTHSLAGWALGQTGLKRKSRKGLAALILGANAPDIDVFFWWVPWAPLATHRGWTHSLVGGVLVLPLGLACLLWLLDRWHVRRGKGFKSGLEMRFGWLVALSYIGCLTHPLLDWQTSYAIQLFAPFDRRWYHNDSLFIIDVWIWTALAAAIGFSRWREKHSKPDWQWPAIVGCTVVLAYITANGLLSALVRNETQMSEPYAQPDVMVLSPPPVLFWQRNVIWRQDHAISQGHYDPLHSLTALESYTEPVADGMTDPIAVRALLTSPEMTRFRRWSILPMAFVERGRCRTLVEFQDARFGMRPGRGRLGQAVTIPTGAAGC